MIEYSFFSLFMVLYFNLNFLCNFTQNQMESCFEELGRILGQLRAVHDQHPDLLGLGEAPVTQVGAAQVEMLPATVINPQLGEFHHRQADH